MCASLIYSCFILQEHSTLKYMHKYLYKNNKIGCDLINYVNSISLCIHFHFGNESGRYYGLSETKTKEICIY